MCDLKSREVVNISTCDSASEDLAISNTSPGDDDGAHPASSDNDGGKDPSSSGYDGDDSDDTSSTASSVSPTGFVGGKPGPPDFVVRLEGDELSKYDRPSICRDTPPIYMRYRKKGESGCRQS